MKARSFLILCATTVVVVIAAGVSVVRDHRPDTTVGTAQKMFPRLLEKTEALAKITLRDATSTLTMEKSDGNWGLKERDGYPVRPDAIRGLVLNLANLETVEAKTQRPELYSRLGVEEVDTEGARSKEIKLLDDKGVVLVHLLVGKSVFGVGEEGGVYVRKPDESRSWLARGRLVPGLEPRDWVERRITDIPANHVRSVRIVHPDGEIIHAAKEAIKDEHFALAGVSDGPPGASPPRNTRAIDALGAVLSGLNLEGLEKTEAIPFADDATARVTVSTFDGLAITADLTEYNGLDWIRIDAEADPASEPAEAGAMGGAQAARAIADRTKGWAYQVSAFAVAPWKKRRDALLKPDIASGS